MRIHDNYFNAKGTGILIRTEADSWFESGGVEDVEIFNNVFDQNNTGGFSLATIEVRSTINDSSSEIPIHRNIRIHNNKFVQIFKPLMILERVDNIEFYDNEIVQGTDYPMWWRGQTEPPNVIVGPASRRAVFRNWIKGKQKTVMKSRGDPPSPCRPPKWGRAKSVWVISLLRW